MNLRLAKKQKKKKTELPLVKAMRGHITTHMIEHLILPATRQPVEQALANVEDAGHAGPHECSPRKTETRRERWIGWRR
jgi:hypothetical protein